MDMYRHMSPYTRRSVRIATTHEQSISRILFRLDAENGGRLALPTITALRCLPPERTEADLPEMNTMRDDTISVDGGAMQRLREVVMLRNAQRIASAARAMRHRPKSTTGPSMAKITQRTRTRGTSMAMQHSPARG